MYWTPATAASSGRPGCPVPAGAPFVAGRHVSARMRYKRGMKVEHFFALSVRHRRPTRSRGAAKCRQPDGSTQISANPARSKPRACWSRRMWCRQKARPRRSATPGRRAPTDLKASARADEERGGAQRNASASARESGLPSPEAAAIRAVPEHARPHEPRLDAPRRNGERLLRHRRDQAELHRRPHQQPCCSYCQFTHPPRPPRPPHPPPDRCDGEAGRPLPPGSERAAVLSLDRSTRSRGCC